LEVLVRQVNQPLPVGGSREHFGCFCSSFPVGRFFLRMRQAHCRRAEDEYSENAKREKGIDRESFEGSMRHRERRPRGRPRLQSPETWERFADYAILKNHTK